MTGGLKFRVMEKIVDMSYTELMILLEALERPDRFIEKRRCNRILYSVSAEYVTSTIKGCGEIKDIGLVGMLLAINPAGNPLFLGQDVALAFLYPNKESRVIVRGRIVRATSEGVGIEFVRSREGF